MGSTRRKPSLAAAAAWLARPVRRPLLLAGLVLAVVVLAIMAPHLLGGRLLVLDDIWTSDLLNNNVPPRAFLGEQLRQGSFPLWAPSIYVGMPLLPQGEAAAMNPLTWLCYGLLPWPQATSVSVALHCWLAGFGMVLLARRLGAQLAGALVAGIAFMLCGVLVEHVKHMNLHHAAAWLPLLVYAADRLRERPDWRSAALLGAVAGLQLTEGHPQMAYVSLFALLPLFGYRLLQRRARNHLTSGRYWSRLAAAGVGALLVAALVATPYVASAWELARSSARLSQDPWAYATRYAFFPENILTLVWAHAFGDGSNATFDARHGIFWESWLYVGVVPVLAAIAAVGVAIRRAVAGSWRLLATSLALLLLAAFAFSLMWGASSPIYRACFAVLPGFGWFRFPHRFGLVLVFAVTLLAGLGCAALLRALRRRRGRRWAAALGCLLVVATAGDLIHIMRRHFPAAQASAYSLPRTVQLMRERAPDGPWRVTSLLAPESHVDAFRHAKGWAGDLAPFIDHRELIQPSSNLYWSVDAVPGYTSMIPVELGAVFGSHTSMGMVVGRHTFKAVPKDDCSEGDKPRFSGPCQNVLLCWRNFAAALGAFNVRYLLTPVPLHRRCRDFAEIGAIEAGMFTAHVYENRRFMPRAYWVAEMIDVPDHTVAAGRLVHRRFRHDRQVLRTIDPASAESGPAPPTPAPGVGGRCTHHSPEPGTSEVSCTIQRAGFVVISEMWHPERRMLHNGKPVEPFVANGVVQGLAVEPGDHDIVIEFKPWYRWLVPVAACSWLLLLVAAAVDRRRRGQPAARG